MTYIVELEHVNRQETGHKFAKWQCVQMNSKLHQEFRKQYPDVWLGDSETFKKAMDEFIENHPMKIVKEEPYVEVDEGFYKTKVRYEVECEER